MTSTPAIREWCGASFPRLTEAAAQFETIKIIGGVAIEAIESWILALLGEPGSEARTDPKERLAEVHGHDTRAEKVANVRKADLARVPEDARSLRKWIERARECSRASS